MSWNREPPWEVKPRLRSTAVNLLRVSWWPKRRRRPTRLLQPFLSLLFRNRQRADHTKAPHIDMPISSAVVPNANEAMVVVSTRACRGTAIL